jgi:hypothetical protein
MKKPKKEIQQFKKTYGNLNPEEIKFLEKRGNLKTLKRLGFTLS